MLVHKELNSVAGSASDHSKSEPVRRKGLNRDDSGIFSASPSPLTPSRTLTAFPPSAIATDSMSAPRGQAAETANSQDGSPVAMGGKSWLADLANVSPGSPLAMVHNLSPRVVRNGMRALLLVGSREREKGGDGETGRDSGTLFVITLQQLLCYCRQGQPKTPV